MGNLRILMLMNDTSVENGLAKIMITTQLIERVYREYAPKLFRLCFKLVEDEVDAENILHDVFESVWKRRDSLIITTSLEAYLTQAVKLQTLRYFRDRVQHVEVETATANNLAFAEHTTEHEVLYNEVNGRLNNLIEQLPNQCQKVYRLSQIQGLNNREIATTLQISESSVEQHKAKAKSLLQKGLSNFRA